MNGSVFAVYDAETIVRYGIALLMFFSMLLAVLYTLWWGLLMIVSWGDENKVKAAVNHIRYAVLGIVILVVILFVAPIFLNLFGLREYGQYFHPMTILQSIQEIAANILWQSSATWVYNTEDPLLPTDSGFTDL